ncbi:hypothetical protein [Vibrio intestinalis]|uniref:hypothetical protein n=1 Tax=Vibrio intestinalis TaxID=2933291 RepID=UPI0021A8B3EA|nr:hypothetical protein [Vibrio intestinalis]
MHDVTKLLKFGPGEVSNSESNVSICSSSSLKENYDWLIFLDSRGLERDCSRHETWLMKLCGLLSDYKISYLVISRPKNITTFPTLINFLSLNKFRFKNLITNLGFVDCTPKKSCFVHDINDQIKPFYFDKLPLLDLNDAIMSGNERIDLYTLRYNDEYLSYLSCVLKNNFDSSYLITTPIVDQSVQFPRKRPLSFYNQIGKSNEIISVIAEKSSSYIIDTNGLDIGTFDGVHYTKSDHRKIYIKVLNELNNVQAL